MKSTYLAYVMHILTRFTQQKKKIFFIRRFDLLCSYTTNFVAEVTINVILQPFADVSMKHEKYKVELC